MPSTVDRIEAEGGREWRKRERKCGGGGAGSYGVQGGLSGHMYTERQNSIKSEVSNGRDTSIFFAKQIPAITKRKISES